MYLQNSKALITLYTGRYIQTPISLQHVTSTFIDMYERRISKLPLLLLRFGGQSPHIYDLYSQINTWTLLLCAFLVSIMILIKTFHEYDDIDVLVPTLESLMSVYQVKPKEKLKNSILFHSFS